MGNNTTKENKTMSEEYSKAQEDKVMNALDLVCEYAEKEGIPCEAFCYILMMYAINRVFTSAPDIHDAVTMINDCNEAFNETLKDYKDRNLH